MTLFEPLTIILHWPSDGWPLLWSRQLSFDVTLCWILLLLLLLLWPTELLWPYSFDLGLLWISIQAFSSKETKQATLRVEKMGRHRSPLMYHLCVVTDSQSNTFLVTLHFPFVATDGGSPPPPPWLSKCELAICSVLVWVDLCLWFGSTPGGMEADFFIVQIQVLFYFASPQKCLCHLYVLCPCNLLDLSDNCKYPY